MRRAILFSTMMLAGLSTACDRAAPDASSAAGVNNGPLRIFVSIPPQADLVERVGGSHVQVEILVGPGQSPHTFTPTPSQIVELQKCDAYFSIGLPFESRLLEKALSSRPDLNVIDSRAGIELRLMDTDHDHDHDADHSQCNSISAAAPDPHVWLDPKRTKTIVQNIYVELCMLDPERREEYRARLTAFREELTKLDARIAETLAPLQGREFFVFHPAYGYFGDSYGLVQKAVEIEGKEPTPRQITELIQQAKAANVKVIFVQPQFALGSARAIAREIDGAVVPLDPLARDYLKNMDDMARKLVDALGAEEP